MSERGSWHTGHSDARGFRQFYREWQPAAASSVPLLALHGSLTHSGMWTALAEHTACVPMLCPDQRGFARSEDAAGDACADFARDALSLAEQLLPPRFSVMGHSFACTIALEVALIAAERIESVVLVDPIVRMGAARPAGIPQPAPESFASLEEAERHFRDTEEGDWPAERLHRFANDVMMRDGERWRFSYTNARLRRLRLASASAAGGYQLFPKAAAVRCPVLVLRGGMSKRFAAEGEQPLRQAFGRAIELVVCPRSGHFPSSTEPLIVADALNAFLAHNNKRTS